VGEVTNPPPLRAAREIRGLTQRQLCDRLAELGHPLTQGRLSQLENGQTAPRPATAAAIAKALDYPAALLFETPVRDVGPGWLVLLVSDCGHAWLTDAEPDYRCPECGRGDGDKHLLHEERVSPALLLGLDGERGAIRAFLRVPEDWLPLRLEGVARKRRRVGDPLSRRAAGVDR
jgi:transcriptional regulator with XRE-family HTH domain